MIRDKQPKKLIQDVCTRWNSCYYMVERLTKLQDSVKTLLALSERVDLNLNPDEWKLCTELGEVLKPFEEVTENEWCGVCHGQPNYNPYLRIGKCSQFTEDKTLQS